MRKSVSAAFAVALVCSGCAGDYVARTKGVREAYQTYRYDDALAQLPSGEKSSPVDGLLELLDRGMILHAAGRYPESIEVLAKADKLYLLQCNSAYPTPAEHCNIAVVRRYRDLSRRDPRIVPGYSSHDDGWLPSALAIAAGARMVEKHVKLGGTDWAHFDSVALDLGTDEFSGYVRRLRDVETIMGDGRKAPTASEHHKYPVRV